MCADVSLLFLLFIKDAFTFRDGKWNHSTSLWKSSRGRSLIWIYFIRVVHSRQTRIEKVCCSAGRLPLKNYPANKRDICHKMIIASKIRLDKIKDGNPDSQNHLTPTIWLISKDVGRNLHNKLTLRQINYPARIIWSTRAWMIVACDLGVTWKLIIPFYSLRWTFRPLMANLLRGREPARFPWSLGW